jgi:hypothetical protein
VTNDEDPEGTCVTGQIRQSLQRISSLKRLSRTIEHESRSAIEGEVKEIEAQVQGIHDSVKEALSTSPQPREASSSTHPEEDDEGWASEQSHDDPAEATGSNQKQRSKTPRTKSANPGSGRRGRTRNSFRRGQVQPTVHYDNVDPTSHTHGATDRGRTGVPSTDATPPPDSGGTEKLPRPTSSGSSSGQRSRPGTAEGSIRHHRLDHIRALHSSPPTRDVSPSRSVRFQDEISPADTARSPPGEDEPDSAKSKVTFDVPRVSGGRAGA